MFAWIAGWGRQAMPGDYGNVNTYFWIPIVGPLLGGAVAAFVYDLGIRDVLKARKGPEPGLESEGRTVQDRPSRKSASRSPRWSSSAKS